MKTPTLLMGIHLDVAVVFNNTASFRCRLFELLSFYMYRKCMKHFTFPCVECWASIYISAISNVYQASFMHVLVLAA